MPNLAESGITDKLLADIIAEADTKLAEAGIPLAQCRNSIADYEQQIVQLESKIVETRDRIEKLKLREVDLKRWHYNALTRRNEVVKQCLDLQA